MLGCRGMLVRPVPLLWRLQLCTVCTLCALHNGAGVLRFQSALEAHTHWPTDDLALLLAGSLLHAGSGAAAAGGSAGGTLAEAEAEAGSSKVQLDGSPDAASTPGCLPAHLVEHVGLGLGCLRAAVVQGLLTRDDLMQVRLGCWLDRPYLLQCSAAQFSHTHPHPTGGPRLQRGGSG